MPEGDKDVSEIMVGMGQAFNSNSMNQLAKATKSSDPEYVEAVPEVQQTEHEIVQLSVTEQISKREDDLSSTVPLDSNRTMEKLETRINDASDDSDFESILLSVCSDDSVKTEGIREVETLGPIHHNVDQSNAIESSGKCIDDIPAYLLEDEKSEVGAEKYYVPRNGDLFKEADRKDETDEMKELLKTAKLLNNSFKWPLLRTVQKHPRLMFHPRVNNHLTQIRHQDPNHIQERMWSIISKAAVKNIHIVGDTHYVMYLPPICDSIYVSVCHLLNNNWLLSVISPILIICQKLHFQRQKGIPWKGPEALIVVSDTNEAKQVHKFCSILLGTNAVCLDLNTPSDKLSIKVKINSFVCCS